MSLERNRRTKVKFDVFGYTFHVIQANDIVRTGKRIGVDLSDAYAAFISRSDRPMEGWLVFGRELDAGIIAHESAHGIRKMLIDAGVRIDDEVFAYHLHRLVLALHKFLKI